MEIKKANALIISGDGINANMELSHAFLAADAKTDTIHVNELISTPQMIHQYDILAFPGGFSFGDEIRSGKVFSIKVKNAILDEIIKFKMDKKLILGICNGFQILVQFNLFSDRPCDKKTYTLTTNDHGKFKNFWTEVKVVNHQTPWLKNINSNFYLPVRHKEGRIYGEIDSKYFALKYCENINGSLENVAGICDASGLVFGLMPHPEAALSSLLQPQDIASDNCNIVFQIFKNAVNYSVNRGV